MRNEAHYIQKTLEQFAEQIDLEGQPVSFDDFELVILANNCTDDSAEIVKDFQQRKPQVKIHLVEVMLSDDNANIGFVRRLLMDEAFARLQKNRFGKGVIMTTDGDTLVAENWIAANLREIENGADAVGGRIIIADSELEKLDAACRSIHLKDEEYRLLMTEIESLLDDLPFDAAPRHHQHFNGSFAVTTEMYGKTGGVPDVKFLEDCAFFDRLQRADAKVRHSPDVKVYTSSRRNGRSEVGLSFQLNQWKNLGEAGEDFMVESAAAIVERFAAKKDLRKIWRVFLNENKIDRKEIADIAARIFVAPEVISIELEKRQTFGTFYEDLMREQNRTGEWARKFPPVTLDKALEGLKDFLCKSKFFPNIDAIIFTADFIQMLHFSFHKISKRIVNLIARLRVIVNRRKPVNERDLTLFAQLRENFFHRCQPIFGRKIITDFGNQDQIEYVSRKFLRNAHLFESDVR